MYVCIETSIWLCFICFNTPCVVCFMMDCWFTHPLPAREGQKLWETTPSWGSWRWQAASPSVGWKSRCCRDAFFLGVGRAANPDETVWHHMFTFRWIQYIKMISLNWFDFFKMILISFGMTPTTSNSGIFCIFTGIPCCLLLVTATGWGSTPRYHSKFHLCILIFASTARSQDGRCFLQRLRTWASWERFVVHVDGPEWWRDVVGSTGCSPCSFGMHSDVALAMRYAGVWGMCYSTCLGSKELVCKSGAGISNVKCDILIYTPDISSLNVVWF